MVPPLLSTPSAVVASGAWPRQRRELMRPAGACRRNVAMLEFTLAATRRAGNGKGIGDMQRSICFAAIMTALSISAGSATADDFYRGKTIRLIVPSAPGGG